MNLKAFIMIELVINNNNSNNNTNKILMLYLIIKIMVRVFEQIIKYD